MDVFADLFRGVRARGSTFGRSTLTAPWSLLFVDGAPLTLCTVLEGGGWILAEDHPPHQLSAGQSIVVRGPGTFRFVDDPATTAAPLDCGAHCATPDGGGTAHRLGWNDCEPTNDAGAPTTLVVGAYPIDGDVGWRLLESLPPLLHIGPGGAASVAQGYIAAEVLHDEPGQQVVLDRLLDWMLVCALREWFDRVDGAPSWYSALKDPIVGPALRLLHDNPADPWTVAALAERAGVSRSTFAKRFTDLLDEPPLAYLTSWRMSLAADLLGRLDGTTISEIAHRVGYLDPFAFSAAFKRAKGLSPSQYRMRVAGRAYTPE